MIKSSYSTVRNTPSRSPRFYQMDLVRYYLAISVIVAHFNTVFGKDIFWCTDSGTAVGVFFGLSGFLVYASYQRIHNFWNYALSRARRILPSYYIVVLSSAILLCTMSDLSIKDYFLSTSLWKYIVSNLTFLNFLQPELPGVFTTNAVPAVNGSLWTLKVEWMLYLTIPLFAYIQEKFSIKFIRAVLGMFAISIIYKHTMNYIADYTGNDLFHKLSYQFAGQFVYFYTGVLYFKYKEHFFAHTVQYLSFGLLLLAAWLLCDRICPESILSEIASTLLYPIGTLTIFLILSTTRIIGQKASILGNCSYEMYLVHFPILQVLACSSSFSSLPEWTMLSVSIILIFIISFFINRLTRHQ